MLGSAPGTDRLNDWVDDLDDDMSIEDLANHIEDSDDFQDEYPAFMTDGEFAEAFMGNLLGDYATAGVSAMVVEAVEGLLGAGHSRGEVALVVVTAMLAIAAEGESHDLYEALGMASTAFHNKVMVAEHYTVMARMEDPSASVLEGVTADADSVMMAKDAIDNSTMEDPMMGMRYVLTPTIDEVMGGDADDTIVAQPIQGASSIFQETLNPFDSIDGGGGDDTIYIYGVDPDAELALVSEDISNVENVVLNTVGDIRAEMVSWEGLMAVDLHRFGHDDNVSVTVDGAMVSTDMTFGGEKVMIAGASGAVDIEASHSTMVHIGSAGHTESVMVKNGGNIMIGKNGDGSGQSMTVTTVSVDGVKEELGKDVPGDPDSAPYMAMKDDNGYVVGQNGTDRISIQVGTNGTPVVRVGIKADGTLTNADSGAAIIVENYSFDHDGDATTDDIDVNVALRFNEKAGGIVFGAIQKEGAGDSAAFPDGITDANANALDGMALPDGVVVIPTPSIGKERGEAADVPEGAMPTLTINSDAIETVHLHNTNAIALVHNNSMTADRKRMPEDLSVTVNKYGDKDQDGKLCITGMGSAENIMLTVAGDSWVDLNSNHVKMLDISADAKLSLKVRKFNADGKPIGPSETLESVMVSGEGAVSMNSLDGMKKLASIDAGGSSGNNSFKSMDELAALTMVMGGSGNDTVGLMTGRDGKLESIDTGGGNDTVMLSGDTYREGGLMVDLGDGDDTFHGGPGNSMSRVEGGDGRDTLRLSGDGATYKDGDKTMSIYSNFEVLDVGGGSGPYDVGRLGVDSVIIGKSTVGSGVALDNVGGGTSLSVSAEKAGTGTEAAVSYTFANDVNVAGSIIDGGTTNVLNVSLMAKGGSGETSGRTAIADLEITLDGDLLAMAINSDASVHRTAAGKGVTSGHYQNKVEVEGTSALEEVKITGDAQTHLSGAGLASLEYVNAAESGAGVAVDASLATGRVRLVGSHHIDDLTVGAFAGTATVKNTLVGNGGDDMLTGGAGMDLLNGGAGADTLRGDPAGGTQVEDRFIYNAASESQVTFTRNDKTDTFDAKGYDKIMDFTSTTDKLHLSKALHAIVTAGGIKFGDEWGAASGNTTPGQLADGRGWNPVDQDGAPGGATVATTSIDGTPNKAVTGNSPANADGGALNLYDFIGSGRGLFMTTVVGQPTDFGATTRQVKNSLAIVSQTTTGDQGTWLLVDVDADGNFDADTDMAIFLAGDAPVAFVANDLSM